jgi:hypothetical protein
MRVSDDYVVSAKLANFKSDSDFRDQAKRMYEVSAASGRTPYFQFDSEPSRDVMNAIRRYDSRYGMQAVVDIAPLGDQ